MEHFYQELRGWFNCQDLLPGFDRDDNTWVFRV